MSKSKPASKGLQPLKLWQAILVPPVLLIVALNTYLRDRICALFLPRRRYEAFVFVPRASQTKSPGERPASLKRVI